MSGPSPLIPLSMIYPFGLMADVHLHPWSAFADTDKHGVNTRLTAILNEVETACKNLKSAGGRNMVIAGDLFHVRGSVSPTVLNSTVATIKKCVKEHNTHFLIIPGNHDLEGRNSEQLGSAVTALAEIEGVEVLNQPHTNGCIVLVPWFENVGDLKAEIESLRDKVKLSASHFNLILHAPVDGVIKGLPSHGLTPEWLSDLGFAAVYSGHYHNHKVFQKEGCGPAVSIGAIGHHSWSDAGSKAGHIIVTGAGEFTFHESSMPKFVDDKELAAVDSDSPEFDKLIKGNYLRVKTADASLKAIEVIKSEAIARGARGVIVQPEPKPPAAVTRAATAVSAGGSVTLEQSVIEYTKATAGDLSEEVSKLALDILSIIGEEE